ncbi:MAG TPA: hypothetical protein VKY59_07055 [Spirillospora sp.]|jgi:hypothetical protein|nr:hypothetical protein [Spirillospora sp.]
MASERIGDMTKAELEEFIVEIIARRFSQYSYVQKSDRPIEEVLESLRQNRLQKQPGQPSVVEMIREDRDR